MKKGLKKNIIIVISIIIVIIVGLSIYFLRNKKEEIKEEKKTIQVEEVNINIEYKTIYKGDNVILKASTSPKNASSKITWSSSDNSIATVKNGKVTGKKGGTVTITATTSNG